MLSTEALHAGYGETRVLHGVDMTLSGGEVVALLGRNGAGKTTTLKAIMGLIRVMQGTITMEGRKVNGLPPYRIAKLGLGYVPETRDIFSSLSVLENLRLPIATGNPGEWTLDRIFGLFPNLDARRHNGGDKLSGGEQQMLAIARALLLNPKLLILDEPTEGLAPTIVRQIHDKLLELKSAGLPILLVEQNLGFATSLADRVYVLGRGTVQWQGTAEEIRADKELQSRWLGV